LAGNGSAVTSGSNCRRRELWWRGFMNPALDNLMWSALTTEQAHLAIGGPVARRFPAAYTPFAGIADFSAGNFDALAELVAPNEEVAMFTVDPLRPTAAWEVAGARALLQMIAGPLPESVHSRTELIALGADDNAEMQAIAEETKPGPFSTRTRELGKFLGVRVEGRLAAMTGERMHLTGYREVTAVCVRPEFRGRGYARELVLAIAQGIRSRGETPMLHVYSDNHSAIALYRSLGFQTRTELQVTRLRRVP